LLFKPSDRVIGIPEELLRDYRWFDAWIGRHDCKAESRR
jgi:hypothetical protein